MSISEKIRLALVAGLVFLVSTVGAHAQELGPPPYELSTRGQVNAASGQVTPSLVDIEIGGAMGLGHRMSSFTSNFVNGPEFGKGQASGEGFTSNYDGAVRRADFFQGSVDYLPILRVFDGTESMDFEIVGPGNYQPLRDQRNTLRWKRGGWIVLTRGDGTVAEFRCPCKSDLSSAPGVQEFNAGYGFLTRIIEPSGKTISIIRNNTGYIQSVQTNTGFQLKYEYVPNTAPLPSAKAALVNDYMPPVDGSWTSNINPTYIWGVNRSVEYCTANKTPCNFSHDWPRSTHKWPAGMPTAMYIGKSTYSVTDYKGRTTHFDHTAIDIARKGTNGSGGHVDPTYHPVDTHFVPRITRIRHHGGQTFEYRYLNYGALNKSGICTQGFCGMPYWQSTGDAVFSSVQEVGGRSHSWGRAQSQHPGTLQRYGGGFGGIKELRMDSKYGVLNSFQTWGGDGNGAYETLGGFEKVSDFHTRLRNLTRRGDNPETIRLEYDDRGNVVKKSINNIPTTAAYFDHCDTENFRYCNKPKWIEDANGNRTHYTYHSLSGQVESVTAPADKNGVKARTFFKYEKKHARIKNANGSMVTMSEGVWMKVEESRCENSTHTGSACAGNDEILTEWKYDHPNLLLTSESVYSQKDQKTLRTCYSYDIYGNRIGVTEPKGSASCDL